MSDNNDALRRLAEAAMPAPIGNMATRHQVSEFMVKKSKAWLEFNSAANPAAVLALLDEIDELREALAASKPEPQAQAGETEVPKWWNCDTHGRGNHTAWGCPECVREMREAIAKKDAAWKACVETCVEALEEVNEWRRTGYGRPPEQTSMDAITQAKEALK